MKEGESRKRKRRRRHNSNSKPQDQESYQSKSTAKTTAKKHKQDTVKNNEQQYEHHQTSAAASAKRPKPSSFLDKMRARLSGGHFRMLNEKLYTCTGKEALDYFNENPALFDMYHSGYQEQMSHWPELPVNIIVKWLKDHSPSLVIADFGCGDARLAKSVKNKVFSFDLVSNDPSVIACDMSNEAQRVLKPSGWLLIAEVKSRFDPNTGGADPNKFSKAVCDLGFAPVSKDFSNKMFIMFYFKKKEKQNSKSKEIQWPELKPCLYKRR